MTTEKVELCPPTWTFVLTVLVPSLLEGSGDYEKSREAALDLLRDAGGKLDGLVEERRLRAKTERRNRKASACTQCGKLLGSTHLAWCLHHNRGLVTPRDCP